MNNPPTFQPVRVFRLMTLPLELRRKIYYFAVVEPHPLPLMTHRFRGKAHGYSVKKDLRMLRTCKEFHTEMDDWLYSENSFTYAIPRHEAEEHTQSSKVDLKRVQKCYIPIDRTTELPDDSDTEECLTNNERFVDDYKLFVTTLAFNSHEMKYVLIQCEPLDYVCLAEGLGLLLSPRNIALIHFRSLTPINSPFRFLEASMMTDWPGPFGDLGLWEKVAVGPRSSDHPGKSWLVKNKFDAEPSGVVRSQEQLTVAAKELYSILGVEGDFIPQGEVK